MYALLLLIGLNPPGPVTIDRVDRLEVNHVYCDNGGLVFDQLIVWTWDMQDGRYHVVDWRLLRDVRRPNEAEKRRWNADHPEGPPYVPEWIGGHATPRKTADGWVSEWWDEKSRKLRRVYASTFIETWLGYDPEMLERSILPECQRIRLR